MTAAVRARRVGAVALLALALAVAPALSGCAALTGLFDRTPHVKPEPILPSAPEATLEGFQSQQPVWQACGERLECADVYAPLDWSDLAGERITLHLVKHVAKSGEPQGTLFVNPGGPGASGADYVWNGAEYAAQPAVLDDYDLIGWDPRGVGDSSAVACLDAAGLDDYLFGLGDEADADLEIGSDAWIDAAYTESEAFGLACAENTGALLGHVDTASTVQDLDMLRAIAGDPQLNYLGYSYGTYIGARYADAYPEKVGRMVLDGAMDPTTTEYEVVKEQTLGFEQALEAYLADCLKRSDCPFTGPVSRGMQQIGAQLDKVDEAPLHGTDGRWLSSGTMLTAIITPLYSQGNWGYLDDLFTSVNEGDADVGLMLADFYYSRENGRYLDNSTEAFMAINCLDYPSGMDRELMREQAAELAELAPTIGRFQGYGDIGCAAWPVTGVESRDGVTAAGAGPILVVGTTGDPATPYRWAESLAGQLESGVLVTYNGEGHTAYGDNDCINRVVDAYFVQGEVPSRDPQCAAG